MSEEPDYVAQTGELTTDDMSRAWFQKTAAAGHEQGCMFFRYSIHPDFPNMGLVEGWKVPPKDQGEQRWAFTRGPRAAA